MSAGGERLRVLEVELTHTHFPTDRHKRVDSNRKYPWEYFHSPLKHSPSHIDFGRIVVLLLIINVIQEL